MSASPCSPFESCWCGCRGWCAKLWSLTVDRPHRPTARPAQPAMGRRQGRQAAGAATGHGGPYGGSSSMTACAPTAQCRAKMVFGRATKRVHGEEVTSRQGRRPRSPNALGQNLLIYDNADLWRCRFFGRRAGAERRRPGRSGLAGQGGTVPGRRPPGVMLVTARHRWDEVLPSPILFAALDKAGRRA